jgi:hypothetical protein
MGKVLQFPKKSQKNQNAQRAKKFSDSLDIIITNTLLDNSLKPMEISGIIAHRLGALLKNIKQKHQLWPLCQTVITQQAQLDPKGQT